MMKKVYDVIIVGAGAAGLMCAANLQVNKGLIIDQSDKPGKKLLLSGGGRCNITHGGSIKNFVSCYGDNGRIIRTCLYKHNNDTLVNFLESAGIRVLEDEEGRIHPESEKAQDVLNLLLAKAKNNGWEIHTDYIISSLLELQGLSDNIVIACGGITYPNTGSDGSLYNLLRDELGLNLIQPRSALAPISVKEYPYGELSGITMHDVEVTIGTGKKAHRLAGDVLLAHNNLTGPAILNISRYAVPGETLRINWIPGSSAPLDDADNLPKRFRQLITNRAMTDKGSISTNKLASLLTSDTFEIEGCSDNGMVTAGGISLDCVDLKTMSIKNQPGFYAIGEVLDIDGNTGGYNLQFCWSSACTAAEAIASRI